MTTSKLMAIKKYKSVTLKFLLLRFDFAATAALFARPPIGRQNRSQGTGALHLVLLHHRANQLWDSGKGNLFL